MIERLARLPFDRRGEPICRAQWSVPQRRGNDGSDEPAGEQDDGLAARPGSQSRVLWAFLRTNDFDADGERTGQDAEYQSDAERRPEIAPKRVHAFSRASSRQPMSRRWKASGEAILANAR